MYGVLSTMYDLVYVMYCTLHKRIHIYIYMYIYTLYTKYIIDPIYTIHGDVFSTLYFVPHTTGYIMASILWTVCYILFTMCYIVQTTSAETCTRAVQT